jgi:hypothetical protein
MNLDLYVAICGCFALIGCGCMAFAIAYELFKNA